MAIPAHMLSAASTLKVTEKKEWKRKLLR